MKDCIPQKLNGISMDMVCVEANKFAVWLLPPATADPPSGPDFSKSCFVMERSKQKLQAQTQGKGKFHINREAL